MNILRIVQKYHKLKFDQEQKTCLIKNIEV